MIKAELDEPHIQRAYWVRRHCCGHMQSKAQTHTRATSVDTAHNTLRDQVDDTGVLWWDVE